MPEQLSESSEQKVGASEQSGGGKTTRVFVLFALFLFLLAVFSIISLKRPADVDEGFHLLSAKSIFVEGRTPYLDFFSFQMPLLPYVYGAVMSLFGYKWMVARMLCASLAAAIGLIICKYALDRTRSVLIAVSIAVMYSFAPYIFIWFTCARTHVLSTFLLLTSIFLLRPINTRSSALLYATSGFLLGLSVDTRLYFAALVPVLAFHVSRVEKERPQPALYLLLGGVAAALMINVPFLLASPLKYLLNVVGYHAIKSPGGLIGNFGQKVDLLLQMLFDYPTLRPTLYLGYILIFVAYPAHQVLRRIPLSEWNPAFYAAGTLFLVSLLPTPTLGQYFAVPIPFFLMLVIDLVQSMLEYLKPVYAKGIAKGMIAVATVLFAYIALGKIDSYVFKGNNLEGSMPTEGGKNDWNLNNVERVSMVIDKLVKSDATVFSLWPGYLLESHVRIMPRTENVTLLEIEDRLSERMVALSQTITDAEIKDVIRAKKIDLFVYGNSIAPRVSEYRTLLIGNGYTVAARVGGISLFLSPDYKDRLPALSSDYP